MQYIGEINRCGFIKVKMGLSVKAALRDQNNQICLGFGAEVVSYQCPAVLTDPLPDPGMGHKVFRKAGHIGHVKNPDFRRGGLSQKQEKERKSTPSFIQIIATLYYKKHYIYCQYG